VTVNLITEDKQNRIQSYESIEAFREVKIKIVVLYVFYCILGGGIMVHSTLRPPNGVLYQPRVIMIMEKSVELLARETEVIGENLPQCRFVHHKPHMLPVREPGPPWWEASD
jgi:hypothetical protein